MGGPNQLLFDLRCDNHEAWLKNSDFAERADFTGRDLVGLTAVLRDLTGAIFTDTNVLNCDFTGAILEDIHAPKVHFHKTNLTGVSFKNAYLRDAKYTETTFENTDLWNVSGDGIYVISLQIGRRYVCYTSDILQIGCQQYAMPDVWWMADEEVLAQAMKGHIGDYDIGEEASLMAWWRTWKSQIYHIVNGNQARPVNKSR